MIPASALLSVRLSPEFVAALAPVRPETVQVRLVPRWMRALWPAWVSAMTLPWAIYIRPEILAGDDMALTRTIAHELVHVRQWKSLGVTRFLYRYLSGYLRARRSGAPHRHAYAAIPLEKEAYALAARSTG